MLQSAIRLYNETTSIISQEMYLAFAALGEGAQPHSARSLHFLKSLAF